MLAQYHMGLDGGITPTNSKTNSKVLTSLRSNM